MKTIQEHQRKAPGMNVGTAERVGSAVGGSALVAYGLSRRSVGGALLALLGGAALYRGITGSCPAYRSLGITSADDDRPLEEQLEERGIRVERAITINRPPEEIYAFWRNFANLPGLMNNLASVDLLSDDRSRWVAEGPAGRKVRWEAMITEEKENEMIGWRSLPHADVESVGNVQFTRCSGGDGTEVKVTLSYSPPAGKAGAALARLFGKDPAQQVEEDLRRLQRMMETGDIPSTRRQPSGRASAERDPENGNPRHFAWGTRDHVEEASWESFPASDPPAW